MSPVRLVARDPQQTTERFLQSSKSVSEEEKNALVSANFNCWRAIKNPAHALCLLNHMLCKAGESFAPNPSTVAEFLSNVYYTYNDNHYHNFAHCFFVSQMMFSMIHTTPQYLLTDYERYACLLAAICHDLDHPGTSNGYQLETRSNLAENFSWSPLENHHIQEAWRVMKEPSADVLSMLTTSERKRVELVISEMILATDMDRLHIKLVEEFKAKKELLDPAVDEDRLLLMKMLLKTCDISNEARPWSMGYQWSVFVTREFHSEGDLRRSQGLGVPPQMDSLVPLGLAGQLKFIKYVALPLYELMVDVTKCDELVKNAKDNIDFYQLLLDQSQTKTGDHLAAFVERHCQTVCEGPHIVTDLPVLLAECSASVQCDNVQHGYGYSVSAEPVPAPRHYLTMNLPRAQVDQRKDMAGCLSCPTSPLEMSSGLGKGEEGMSGAHPSRRKRHSVVSLYGNSLVNAMSLGQACRDFNWGPGCQESGDGGEVMPNANRVSKILSDAFSKDKAKSVNSVRVNVTA